MATPFCQVSKLIFIRYKLFCFLGILTDKWYTNKKQKSSCESSEQLQQKNGSVIVYANYHTHTARCKHAKGEDREYVEAAIRGGMKVLGFSDHCPWILNQDYVSGTRMEVKELDSYIDSISRLKKEYETDITIYIGFECEYIPELMEEQDNLLKDYPIDYKILGQHFLCPEPYARYTGLAMEDESILEEYVDLIMEGMESGRYLYVAHPDLIHFTGSSALYEKHMLRLCKYLKEKELPVEINLLECHTSHPRLAHSRSKNPLSTPRTSTKCLESSRYFSFPVK